MSALFDKSSDAGFDPQNPLRSIICVGSKCHGHTPSQRGGRRRCRGWRRCLILHGCIQGQFNRWKSPLSGLITSQILNICLAVAESLTLIACTYPTSPISQPLLAVFVQAGNPTHIRMTLLYFIAWLLTVCGGVLRRQCYREMGRFFTFVIAVRDGHRLIKTGPYRYVRHPAYTALFAGTYGFLLIHLSSGSWLKECSGISEISPAGKAYASWGMALIVIGLTAGTIARTFSEDQLMKDAFGREWDSWASRVHHRLIPGVF